MTDRFRLYVFDRDNRIVRSLDMIAPDRVTATKLARGSAGRHSDAHSYELWQAARSIHPAWILMAKEKRRVPRQSGIAAERTANLKA
jgi:hypothetical protein